LGGTNSPAQYDGAQILKFTNGKLYFTSLKNFHTKLFSYDGTQVSQTVDLFPQGDDSVQAFTSLNNKVFASITVQDNNTRLFDLSTTPAKIISNTSVAGVIRFHNGPPAPKLLTSLLRMASQTRTERSFEKFISLMEIKFKKSLTSMVQTLMTIPIVSWSPEMISFS
jgi:hypothetical protein